MKVLKELLAEKSQGGTTARTVLAKPKLLLVQGVTADEYARLDTYSKADAHRSLTVKGAS